MVPAPDRRGLERLRELLHRLGPAIAGVVQLELDILGAEWTSRMGRRVTGPLYLGPGKPRNALLATRTGQLAGSFDYILTGSTGDPRRELRLYSSDRKAAYHEFGATIRPVNARFLTIPLPAAMTPSGIARWPNARAAGPGTFVLRAKSGALFIVRRTQLTRSPISRHAPGKAQAIEFLYLLHPGPVRIPPRLGMVDTLAALLPRFQDRLAAGIDAILGSS